MATMQLVPRVYHPILTNTCTAAELTSVLLLHVIKRKNTALFKMLIPLGYPRVHMRESNNGTLTYYVTSYILRHMLRITSHITYFVTYYILR